MRKSKDFPKIGWAVGICEWRNSGHIGWACTGVVGRNLERGNGLYRMGQAYLARRYDKRS
jgi:hypothetical protein